MANIIDKTRPEVVPLKPVEYEGVGRPDDSRIKFKKVTHPTLPLERTYCSYCGRPYGWTSTEGSEMVAASEVIVICEQCEEGMRKLGPIPFAVAGDKNTTEFTLLCQACHKPEADDVHRIVLGLVGRHTFVTTLKSSLPSRLGE